MPAKTEYEYDVFISYQSADRPWAGRLSESLKKKNLKVFLDIEGLRAGQEWRPQLLKELEASRHLVCLWSNDAEKSSWVSKELFHFDNSHADTSSTTSAYPIFVLLDNDNVPHNNLQMIPTLKQAKVKVGDSNVSVYDAGAGDRGVGKLDQSDPGLWPDVVEQIYQTVIHGHSLPIPLLILTTTSDRLSNVDSTEPPDHLLGAESLDELLKRLGLDKDRLLKRYSHERTDWKPWGSDRDIMNILNTERDEITGLENAIQFHWDLIGEDFWSGDPKKTEVAVGKLLTPKLAVIVVDPISLYDGRVYNRFTQLSSCWDNPQAIFIVLPPFALPNPSRVFREAIERISLDMFRDYYEPGVRRLPCAKCNVNFGDDRGIRRSLLATLRNHFHQVEAQTTPTLATMGGTKPDRRS
jgi:hypothetical protein